MREDILNRLRERAQSAERPGEWHSRRQFSDLAERFAATLTANSGEVHRAASFNDAIEQALAVVTKLGAQRVVVNGDAPAVNWQEHLPDLTWTLAAETDAGLREACAQADVGISGADALLAETGTAVVSSGDKLSRLVTLLPPVHLVIASTQLLTSDLFTWLAAKPDLTPANVTLISGPSKTADIEMTLSVGVHGPKRLIVILYT